MSLLVSQWRVSRPNMTFEADFGFGCQDPADKPGSSYL